MSPRPAPSAPPADLPQPDVIERAAALFATLSDPNRIRILTALADTDELCVHEIAEVADMHESTTSHALRLLRAHRMVRARRVGRTVCYRLDDEHVRHVLTDVLAHLAHETADAG